MANRKKPLYIVRQATPKYLVKLWPGNRGGEMEILHSIDTCAIKLSTFTGMSPFAGKRRYTDVEIPPASVQLDTSPTVI